MGETTLVADLPTDGRLNPAGRRLDLSEVAPLLSFAAAAEVPDGFASLDVDGRPSLGEDGGPAAPVALVTARMTYCFAIGALLGSATCAELAAHGVDSLRTRFQCGDGSGFSEVIGGARGELYLHAFMVLASSTAMAAAIPGADALAAAAGEAIEPFWNAEPGVFQERIGRVSDDGSGDYLGANANMHTVEALLAASTVSPNPSHLQRARSVAGYFVDRHARARDWMLPEHHTLAGAVLLDHNRKHPADEFRPYGVTIGHLFEWSRLLLELESAASGPGWLGAASDGLYRAASRLGWVHEPTPGFVYTVDWDGRPVVTSRPHWVLTEAIGAAGVRAAAGRDVVTARADLAKWRRHATNHYHDTVRGSWHHELDELGHPLHRLWAGKPDAYHILNALLIPQLPVAPSLAARLIAPKA